MRESVLRFALTPPPGGASADGPPRVSRSSKLRALTFTPPPARQKFLNSQCALKLPPSSSRSPPKLNDDHWLKLMRIFLVYFPGVSHLTWNQLLCGIESARRMKPTSLVSNPGDRKPTLTLNRVRWPAILLNATLPVGAMAELDGDAQTVRILENPVNVR